MRVRERGVVLGVAATAALMLAMVAPAGALPGAPPNVGARAAIVLDASTGEILWARDADRQLPPASTTKIMTTLLALESGRLERSFSVSPFAAAQAPSKLGLRAGQRVELEDLTYALMLKSANDASVVVAEGLAGNVGDFAALMNQRARDVGATNTQFQNPHGLPNPDHLSTVHDMALILRHALTVPGFREVAGSTSKVIQIEDSKIRPVSLHTKNRLLNGYFVSVLGKTGYTRAAGRCFAGAAELNGRRVITVVFGAADMWGDTRKLMEFGFASFDDTAPAVQLALEQARRNPPRTTVAKASKRRSSRATVVASKSKSRKAATSQVASSKSSKAAKSVKRAKATVQTAAKARSTKAAASQKVASSSRTKSSADRHAKLETSSTRSRR